MMPARFSFRFIHLYVVNHFKDIPQNVDALLVRYTELTCEYRHDPVGCVFAPSDVPCIMADDGGCRWVAIPQPVDNMWLIVAIEKKCTA